jgi:chromosome segregation and condensation protein ScpB
VVVSGDSPNVNQGTVLNAIESLKILLGDEAVYIPAVAGEYRFYIEGKTADLAATIKEKAGQPDLSRASEGGVARQTFADVEAIRGVTA